MCVVDEAKKKKKVEEGEPTNGKYFQHSPWTETSDCLNLITQKTKTVVLYCTTHWHYNLMCVRSVWFCTCEPQSMLLVTDSKEALYFSAAEHSFL